jgi:hypothetical protein
MNLTRLRAITVLAAIFIIFGRLAAGASTLSAEVIISVPDQVLALVDRGQRTLILQSRSAFSWRTAFQLAGCCHILPASASAHLRPAAHCDWFFHHTLRLAAQFPLAQPHSRLQWRSS